MESLEKYQSYSWLLLLVPIYVFLFVKLGNPHIRLWDEGWFAVHAVEMLEQGSLFVSYFNGVPSYTSSKPPLQTWLQMLSISIIGISELAVRLPSALAAAGSALVIYFTTRKLLGNTISLMATMVLLTSIGFIGYHTARGAEADSLLTLALTCQAVCFYRYSESKKWTWLFATFIMIGVGFWSKSTAGFLFIPGMLVYAIIYERAMFKRLLQSWQFYACVGIAALSVLSYLGIRENVQPGYLAMFFKSNVGRYTSSVGHDNAWTYFLRNMYDARYLWWFPFAILGFVLSFTAAESSDRFAAFASVCALSFLLFISLSKSKLVWYDMPIYPMAAISVAYGINRILKNVSEQKRALMIGLLFLFPTIRMFQHTQAMSLNLQEMEFEAQEVYMNEAYRDNKDLNNFNVIHDHFNGSLIFYKHKFEGIGQNIELTNSTDGFAVGSKILVHGTEHKEEVENKYIVEEIDRYRSAIAYHITGYKQ